jgi:hypothetical protein
MLNAAPTDYWGAIVPAGCRYFPGRLLESTDPHIRVATVALESLPQRIDKYGVIWRSRLS